MSTIRTPVIKYFIFYFFSEMSKKFNLPFLQPVTPGGRLTDEVGEFAGRTVKTFTYTDHTEEGVDKDEAGDFKETHAPG